MNQDQTTPSAIEAAKPAEPIASPELDEQSLDQVAGGMNKNDLIAALATSAGNRPV